MISNRVNSKDDFKKFVSCNWNDIQGYLDREFRDLPTSIYSSVDIRESEHKIAPVDNNLYPAGLNNLCNLDLIYSSKIMRQYIEENVGAIKNIAIIPESHTKNKFYLDHLFKLKECLEKAGYKAIIISFDQELFQNGKTSNTFISQSGYHLTYYSATIHQRFIRVRSDKVYQEIDLAILNNDQSHPILIPVSWEEIKTPVSPSPNMGWYNRKKSTHFEYYKQTVDRFCQTFNINPEIILANFKSFHNIDFSSKSKLNELGNEVNEFIKDLPPNNKVFVKADKGTYGMGISVVSSGNEIPQMNRKKRNKMDIGKNNIKFNSVIIQEGIETILKKEGSPAEITIYLIGSDPVGGFLRSNPLKNNKENLNSKGMVFHKFCMSEIKQNDNFKSNEGSYSVVAQLSTYASSLEIRDYFNHTLVSIEK